ncbi:HAD family hydrolase [Haloechinothrix halophila]|uniref:HAD family hydrolase n=1 Tax=Haloechinothrix halophila TaxID=1069073 RepID=UPI0003F7E695|nr:HAD family phosphatase [Haloechinothrix halophila]
MTATPRATGVILDMDGVIVDSEHLWERSWRACCARRGVRWESSDTATVQGMSSPEWAAFVAAKLGDPGLADEVRSECVDLMVAAISAGDAPLLDGAADLIRKASERVPLALASSAARRVIDAVLDAHDLTGHFAATVSSEEVSRGKPSPDVYLAAARRIDVEPADAVAVEDSGNGIRAAHAAGLTVIAIPNPQYPPKPDALAHADVVAAGHRDALDALLARLS